MDEITSGIWSYVLNTLDISYILLCNIITFLIITSIERYPKIFKKTLKTFDKKIISSVVAIILGIICTKWFNHNFEYIFYGFFLQFFTYDYIWKYIIKKLNDINKTKENE